jgi:PKD repeat protein
MKSTTLIIITLHLLLCSTYTATAKKLINAQDSMIFDLNASTLTATYFEFPVYLKSDDIINSFDFAFQFNTTKLTFFSTTTTLPGNNSVSHTSYYNPLDLYLRSTLSSLSALPMNQTVLLIRFTLAAPCTSLSVADFYSISGILNGVVCSTSFRLLQFNRFIPAVSFTSTPTCINRPIQYISTSTIAAGQLLSYNWQIANQYSQTAQSFVYTYTAASVYPFTLSVCSTASCCSSAAGASTVSTQPVLAFTYTADCVTDSVDFVPSSPITITSFAAFNWLFTEQDTVVSAFAPRHRFAVHGGFYTTFSVVTNENCRYGTTQFVTVKPGDINQDGDTNVTDFLIFSPQWGLDCE